MALLGIASQWKTMLKQPPEKPERTHIKFMELEKVNRLAICQRNSGTTVFAAIILLLSCI